MKIYEICEILMLIIYSLNNNIIVCQDMYNNFDIFTKSPKLIKHQLCSFNSISKINLTNIECNCYAGFVKDKQIRKINNYEVDCSYLLKSRLIAFTLSLIFPFGLDYFYLGHYAFGTILLLIVIIIYILNICLLNWVLIYDKLSSVGNVDIVFEKKYIKFKYSVIIINIIYFLFYIINVIMEGVGVIKDSNGFYPIYDFQLDL